MESFAKSEVLERMIEERDLTIDSLEDVISSDTELIGEMKDTIGWSEREKRLSLFLRERMPN